MRCRALALLALTLLALPGCRAAPRAHSSAPPALGAALAETQPPAAEAPSNAQLALIDAAGRVVGALNVHDLLRAGVM